jgi:putative sterol carrier protein
VIDDALVALVERFNRKVDANPKVRGEVEGLAKTIAVRFSDGGRFAVDLRDAHLVNLRAEAEGAADLTIRTDWTTFRALLAKEMGPMKALALRKLVLEGTLEDKLTLRRLL